MPRHFTLSLLLLLPIGCIAGTTAGTNALTQVDVVWTADFQFNMPLSNNEGEPLAGGTPVQIGYFGGIASTADPDNFGPDQWESFIPIAGDGSRNPGLDPRIDSMFVGYISTSIIFRPALHQDIPTAPDPDVLVGIRFFDGPTVASSSFYNTVSTAGWIMGAADEGINTPFPTQARLDLVLLGGSLTWESGDAGFRTSIPVPEPSSALLVFLGCSLLVRRFRQ